MFVERQTAGDTAVTQKAAAIHVAVEEEFIRVRIKLQHAQQHTELQFPTAGKSATLVGVAKGIVARLR
jgi:hypothetical protein